MCHLQSGCHLPRRFCGGQRFSLLVECNQIGYRCPHYCSGEGRDCNQRLITNGCEAAVTARGAGTMLSLASLAAGAKKTGRQLRSPQPVLKAATPCVQPQSS
jgi:hypothetical protein